MGQALVGRQPILDRDLDVFGYELLFRPETQNSKPVNGESATSQVVNKSVKIFYLDEAVVGHGGTLSTSRRPRCKNECQDLV